MKNARAGRAGAGADFKERSDAALTYWDCPRLIAFLLGGFGVLRKRAGRLLLAP